MLKLAIELLEDVPPRLGPYRILERIGEGGMGVVYLAEQDPPLARRVAIKLARNAIRDGRALARFESERQTLAVMNHPNIARVFDAGSAPDSRPFFVMEYVAGESITDFCDSRQLGIEPRLELFLRVCDGVQHAHLNAVIHRDLKPANILVTTEGGPPTPKIIDFGVAKALDTGAGATRGATLVGQVVGTPEYMSPEQAALDGRAVDSRTDVYSLGVVLYELLVGGRPFERGSGPDASIVDLCRRIREEEPERPSLRALRASGVDATRRLRLAPSAFARRLRGDLDAIAIKALAKDPRGRYATPADMAIDIERHLQHRPIHARWPGPLVRLRKTLRRHRATAAVVATLSVTLIGLAILGTAQAMRARAESARAEDEARVGSEVRKFVLGVIDPPRALVTREWRGSALTSDRDALLDRIRERFAEQPLLQAQLLFAVGNHMIATSNAGREIPTLVESRDRITALLGADSSEALAANEGLGRAYMFLLRFQEAEPLLLDALERRRRADPDGLDTWRTTVRVADLYKFWHRHDQAAPLFEAAIAGLERQLGPEHPDVLSTRVGLSGSYLDLHRYRETRVLLEQALDAIRQVFGERDYQTSVALYNLACANANLGRPELALEYLGQSLATGWGFGAFQDVHLLPLHGDPRFDELDRMGRVQSREDWPRQLRDAQASMREDRLADAERRLVELLAAIERVDRTGAGGWATYPRWALAQCRIRQERFDEAEGLLLPTLAATRADGNAIDERQTLHLLAQCDIGRGHRESALARLAAVDAFLHPVFGNLDKHYVAAQNHALHGRDDDALRSLARAAELGFDDVERLEHDLAFVKLRARTEFWAVAEAARRRALLFEAAVNHRLSLWTGPVVGHRLRAAVPAHARPW